jgi:hypothetical protein
MFTSKPQRFALPPRYWRLRPIQLIVIDLFDWLFPFFGINLVWLLASLTVVLMPPATATLFEIVYDAHRGVVPDARRFRSGIRRWFWKSWGWASGNLVVLATAFFLGRSADGNPIVLAVAGVIPAVVIVGQFYFWPYMMLEVEPQLIRALRNSIFTALGGLPYLISYLALALFIAIPGIVTIAPFLFVVPVIMAMISTYSLVAWLAHQGILHNEQRDL